MAVICVKNTFITLVHDPNDNLTESRHISSTKRSSSCPPNLATKIEGRQLCGLEPQDDHMIDRDICASPCIVSPRSDFSTTASSHPNYSLQARRPVTSCDSESVADWEMSGLSHAFDSDRLDMQAPWTTYVGGVQVAQAPETGNSDQDCISTGEYKDFSICLDKAGGGSLGLDLDRSDGMSLFIKSVTRGGLVERFNQVHPDVKLLEGDRIVMVNSVSGSALELLRECQRRNVLRLRVLRNARPELLTAMVAAFFSAQSSVEAVSIVASLEAGASAKGTATAAATAAAPVPGLCKDVSTVLRSVARELTFSALFQRKVKNVQLMEGPMGASSTMSIELRPSYVPSDAPDIRALVMSSLLDAAAQSESTYILGYLGAPFRSVGESVFRATIAKMPDADDACWDYYQTGFCRRWSSCRWCHPEGLDLMTLWVNLKF